MPATTAGFAAKRNWGERGREVAKGGGKEENSALNGVTRHRFVIIDAKKIDNIQKTVRNRIFGLNAGKLKNLSYDLASWGV